MNGIGIEDLGRRQKHEVFIQVCHHLEGKSKKEITNEVQRKSRAAQEIWKKIIFREGGKNMVMPDVRTIMERVPASRGKIAKK